MEVKIGIVRSNEVSMDVDDSTEDVQAAVTQALADNTPLSLKDKQGRVVMVPAAQIAYVDLAGGKRGRVGFGAV